MSKSRAVPEEKRTYPCLLTNEELEDKEYMRGYIEAMNESFATALCHSARLASELEKFASTTRAAKSEPHLEITVLRDGIGQAINDAIASGVDNPDWCDSREIDRLADAVIDYLMPRSNIDEGALRDEFERQHQGRNLTKHRLRGTYLSANIAALWNQHKRTYAWATKMEV